MSTSVIKEERQKKRTLVLRPSSRTLNISGVHGVNQSTRHTNSVVGSQSRKSFSLGGGSRVLEKSLIQTPRQAVRVFDEEDNDVTPQPVYQADPAAAVQVKASRLFMDELSPGSSSDQSTATGSFAMPFSSLTQTKSLMVKSPLMERRKRGRRKKKKEGIIAWSSFKKLVTPKKRVKRSSESEDKDTSEKPAKSATLSSSESAPLTDKSVEEEDKEDKPAEEEPKTEVTEKVVSSTEEPKKKMDTSVSWEALMCMGGPNFADTWFSTGQEGSLLGSERISSQSTIESMNEEIEDTFSTWDMPINFPDVPGKKDTVKEHVTENMLKELIGVYISETDTISLLDIPSTSVSVDADDADAIMERNKQYAEVCRNRLGNSKYVDRSMQTVNGAAKNKQIQSDCMAMVDSGTNVTNWDMYDYLLSPEQDDTVCGPEPERADYPEAVVDTSRGTEMSVSVGSTASTASAASSMKELEASGSSSNAESDLQLIMQSEKFQHILLVMERSVLLNTFQPKLAAYRQLPVLEDPDRPVEQREVETEGPRPPAVEHLWTFSCELSRGRSVSSTAWNKKNPDLLAVGYGELDSSEQKPGLVCCWSLKNSTWPERVIHCDSAVTSLDFSFNSPGQLAVGMQDGNIAIYNVQSQDNKSCVSSSGCPNKHLGPVWQVRWIQQELSLTGEEKMEALFSVAADGRICKWFVNNGLDCIELMTLKKMRNMKKKAGGNKTEQKTESVLSALTAGLCFDFHPKDSRTYLVGTWEGFIHKCSCSNNQQFLETYKKHFCAVNHVTWSPLHPDVFLSCSSDWTIQLWKQDHLHPVLGFTSTQRAVCDIKWSPKWATVFGVVNEGQLEIWDLNSNILDPVITQPAAPGVKMKSLLFATQTDCVLVGDSNGQVTVYQLKNLSVGESSQVETLEGIVCSAASR